MHNQVAERKRLEGNIQHFSVSTEKQNQKRAERPLLWQLLLRRGTGNGRVLHADSKSQTFHVRCFFLFC